MGLLPATYIVGTRFIYFSWLNAYDPEKYSVETIGFQVYSSLALTIMLIVVFIYCVVTLIRK